MTKRRSQIAKRFATRTLTPVLASALLAGAAACTPAPEEPTPEALTQFELNFLPDHVENRTFIDFESKLTIVGYDVQGEAAPGNEVKLRLYWRRTGPLSPDWRPFVHVLLDATQKRVISPKRGDAPLHATKETRPASWNPNKIYVDPHTFKIPSHVASPEITVTAGVENGRHRLNILGAPTASQQRAIITHLKTGVTPDQVPPKKRAKKM